MIVDLQATIASWKKGLLFLACLLTLVVGVACGGRGAEFVEEPARRGNTEVLATVQDITAEVLGISMDEVSEEADFRSDLGADDAAMAEISDLLEEEFSIDLSDEEVNGLTTVQSAVELVVSKQ